MKKRFFACLLSVLLLLSVLPVSAEDVTDPWPFAVRNGDQENKQIAITVDDCYSRDWVRKIFDLCVSHQVCVTFFPVGDQLKEEDADLWREIAASPYAEIGSHTWHHLRLSELTNRSIISSLTKTQETLDAVLGEHYQINSVRPPFGTYRDPDGSGKRIRGAVTTAGTQHLILWDVSQTDASIAIKKVRNGSILLYHTKNKDYRCLETLIPALLEKGFEPVTVSELLGFTGTGYAADLQTP